MKSNKNTLSYYKDRICRDEMRCYYAGDTLPEVVVNSGYGKVYGMNYNSWILLNPTFGWGVGGGNFGGGDGSNIYGGGGGSGSPSAGTSSLFAEDFNNFLTAISLGAGITGLTAETINHFFSAPQNVQIFTQIANSLAILGITVNLVEIGDRIYTQGFENLTANDYITIISTISAIGALLLGAGPLAGIILGIGGLFGDVYKIQNPPTNPIDPSTRN